MAGAVTHAGGASDHQRWADRVRRLVAGAYGARPASQLILAPGGLAALRLVLAARAVRRVVLSPGEYFGARSFAGLDVTRVRPEALADHVARRRPGAVVLSVVTWRGERLPLEACFAAIRERLGAAAPLLVADFAHGGAAGFPPAAASGADVVIGDAGKWLTPPAWSDRVAWLWTRPGRARALARRVFAPFYLARTRPSSALESRWVDPEALAGLAAWAARARVSRRALAVRHQADLALAAELAERCGVRAPATALLWLPSAALARRLPAWVEARGLLWRVGSGARVTCRSDAAPVRR